MGEDQKLKTMTILFRTANTIQQISKEDVKQYTCNLTEFGVLEALHQKGAMTIQQLREKVLIANSSMTYVLDQLEKKKYVERVQNEQDRRNYLIRLTNEGFKYTFDIVPKHYDYMHKVFDVLDAEETQTLQNLLKKLGYHADQVKGDC